MKYVSGLIIDSIIAMSFYFGVLYSMNGLVNIGYFAGWLFGIINLLGFLSKDVKEKMEIKYKHQPIVWRVYDSATDIAYVCFAVYSGWFVLATVYAFQAICKAQFKAEQEQKLQQY